MPGIMEADDEGTYVVKYRGAGQGPKALVAELLSGEIGRALGLPVPEAVLIDVDPATTHYLAIYDQLVTGLHQQ